MVALIWFVAEQGPNLFIKHCSDICTLEQGHGAAVLLHHIADGGETFPSFDEGSRARILFFDRLLTAGADHIEGNRTNLVGKAKQCNRTRPGLQVAPAVARIGGATKCNQTRSDHSKEQLRYVKGGPTEEAGDFFD